jgi:hypothetical protein
MNILKAPRKMVHHKLNLSLSKLSPQTLKLRKRKRRRRIRLMKNLKMNKSDVE